MLTPSAAFRTIGWLTRETLRQARATRLSWLMLGLSALCIISCLGARIEGGRPLMAEGAIELTGPDGAPMTGPNPTPGRLSLAFGAIRIGLFRDGAAEVHFLQVLLAKWVAGAAGTLLALIWTAGFLPEFLQPDAAAVMLAKPVPRWCLLTGKVLGVLAFVAVQAALFFVGTWLALGCRTGTWTTGYLLGIPLLLLNFAIVYGISALLAVGTRNTATCVFGSLVFWLICFGMNYGRHAVVALPMLAKGQSPLSPIARFAVESGYWILPKPADLVLLLDRALDAGDHFRAASEFAAVQQMHAFHPWLSVLTSLAFAAAMLAIASRQLARIDY